MLPGMPRGGMDVCARIRELNHDIPVLMLTALDSTRKRVEGLDAGADDYLVKPFHLVELDSEGNRRHVLPDQRRLGSA